MNSTKPSQTRQCTCGCEFQPTVRNQRYCPSCREKRAQAAEMLRVKTCRHCNAEKPLSRGICAECREVSNQARRAAMARREAKLMARFGPCKECGKPANGPGDQLCLHHSIEQRRKEEHETQARKAVHQDIMEKFLALPEEGQWKFIEFAIHLLASPIAHRRATVEVSPEEVPADNQDAVDAAFFDIMADVAI